MENLNFYECRSCSAGENPCFAFCENLPMRCLIGDIDPQCNWMVSAEYSIIKNYSIKDVKEIDKMKAPNCAICEWQEYYICRSQAAKCEKVYNSQQCQQLYKEKDAK